MKRFVIVIEAFESVEIPLSNGKIAWSKFEGSANGQNKIVA